MSTATLPRPAGGLVDWVSATDHKRVAVRMMVLCAVFFFLGGTLALTMRSELARPGLQYVSTSTYDQLFTMHGSTMIFLVMTPLAVALGAYLVPLQIGAADLVAPRLNLFCGVAPGRRRADHVQRLSHRPRRSPGRVDGVPARLGPRLRPGPRDRPLGDRGVPRDGRRDHPRGRHLAHGVPAPRAWA